MICKEAIGNGELRENYTIRCLVDNLLVKCPNHKNGCAWIDSAKEAPWHEELCSKKNEEGAVVPEDELPYYNDSILAPGKDVNDHLSIGPTLSSKPEVTCGGACNRFDVTMFVPMKQIFDLSYKLEETMGVHNTVLVYDPDRRDIETLTRINFDAGSGAVVDDEQDLKIQDDAYNRLCQRFFAGHWKTVNGFSVPCDPERHVSPTAMPKILFQ